MKLQDLLSPAKSYQVNEIKRLGEGAQGDVMLIQGFGDSPRGYALKLYRNPSNSAQAKHLIRFVNHIQSQAQLKAISSLPLPLCVVEESEQHRVGCIMRLISGTPLDRFPYHDLYTHPNGLRARLCAARSLADTIANLHRYRIVSADIADPNLHLDLDSLIVFHTDLDGGGVLESSLEDRYLVPPLVRGHYEGSCMAPELLANKQSNATLASDRWSLAVILHKLLFAGLDPFFTHDTYYDVVERPGRWPARQASSISRQRYIPFHSEECLRLGPVMNQRFMSVFQHTKKQWKPELRPKADDWANDLAIATEWVQTCPHCNQEIIAEGLQNCPLCNHRLHPAIVWTRQSCIPLDRQGKSLLGTDLGFTDRDGRYVVAVFGRRNGKLCLVPQVSIFDVSKHKQYEPYESVLVDHRSTASSFYARSDDGRQKAEFRVQTF